MQGRWAFAVKCCTCCCEVLPHAGPLGHCRSAPQSIAKCRVVQPFCSSSSSSHVSCSGTASVPVTYRFCTCCVYTPIMYCCSALLQKRSILADAAMCCAQVLEVSTLSTDTICRVKGTTLEVEPSCSSHPNTGRPWSVQVLYLRLGRMGSISSLGPYGRTYTICCASNY
jgi:hypothetical protein